MENRRIKTTELIYFSCLVTAVVSIVVSMTITYFLIQNSGIHKEPTEQSTETQQEINYGQCKVFEDPIGKQCPDDFIGLSRTDATKKAVKNGLYPMAVRIDGNEQYRDDLHIENGMIPSNAIFFTVEDNLVVVVDFEYKPY